MEVVAGSLPRVDVGSLDGDSGSKSLDSADHIDDCCCVRRPDEVDCVGFSSSDGNKG